MASYSVNKVIIIGNLTRDPELRYTAKGTPVCSFSIATSRNWTSPDGESREDTEFHNIVAWAKLAEICSNLLHKGRKVYVSGRLQTKDWQPDDGIKRYKTEIVIDEMIALGAPGTGRQVETESNHDTKADGAEKPKGDAEKKPKVEAKQRSPQGNQEINPDDIPF